MPKIIKLNSPLQKHDGEKRQTELREPTGAALLRAARQHAQGTAQ